MFFRMAPPDDIHKLRDLAAVLHGIKRKKCFKNTIINGLCRKENCADSEDTRQNDLSSFSGHQAGVKARKTPDGMANSKGNSRFTVVWKIIR